MSKDNAIIPTEQREISFYDDMVTAVIIEDGTVYVPVRPLCELIGVSWSGQSERINRDPVLSDMTRFVRVTRTNSKGGNPNVLALPLSHLNGWLFGMNANRVKDSARDALIRYQRECYTVLFEAFSTGIATRPDDNDELMQSSEPAAIAFRNALSVAKLAREQFYLSRKVDEHDRRLGLIEAQLSNPAALITQQQAQQVSEAVKSIATVLGNQSGRNEFGGVYGEMYRRYGITSYKRLPAAKFEAVMGWLRAWWTDLTSDNDAPF